MKDKRLPSSIQKSRGGGGVAYACCGCGWIYLYLFTNDGRPPRETALKYKYALDTTRSQRPPEGCDTTSTATSVSTTRR